MGEGARPSYFLPLAIRQVPFTTSKVMTRYSSYTGNSLHGGRNCTRSYRPSFLSFIPSQVHEMPFSRYVPSCPSPFVSRHLRDTGHDHSQGRDGVLTLYRQSYSPHKSPPPTVLIEVKEEGRMLRGKEF